MGERRGTKALELWCRRMTEGYPGVKIDNMTTSWRDGMAFCAMVHRFRPELIEFDKLNKNDIYFNNELAFRVAESQLGIPALLDAADMASYEVPDRLSILTYLSQYYQTFASQDSPSRLNKRPSSTTAEKSPLNTTGTPAKMAHVIGVPKREPCQKCNLPIFLAERLNFGQHLYHRTCLKCARCQTQLTLGSFYETEVDGEFCCETCPDEEKDRTDAATASVETVTSVADVTSTMNTSLTTDSTRISFNEKLAIFQNNGKGLLHKSLSDEEKSKSLKRLALYNSLQTDAVSGSSAYKSNNALSSFITSQVGGDGSNETRNSTAVSSDDEDDDEDDGDDDDNDNDPPQLPTTKPPLPSESATTSSYSIAADNRTPSTILTGSTQHSIESHMTSTKTPEPSAVIEPIVLPTQIEVNSEFSDKELENFTEVRASSKAFALPGKPEVLPKPTTIPPPPLTDKIVNSTDCNEPVELRAQPKVIIDDEKTHGDRSNVTKEDNKDARLGDQHNVDAAVIEPDRTSMVRSRLQQFEQTFAADQMKPSSSSSISSSSVSNSRLSSVRLFDFDGRNIDKDRSSIVTRDSDENDALTPTAYILQENENESVSVNTEIKAAAIVLRDSGFDNSIVSMGNQSFDQPDLNIVVGNTDDDKRRCAVEVTPIPVAQPTPMKRISKHKTINTDDTNTLEKPKVKLRTAISNELPPPEPTASDGIDAEIVVVPTLDIVPPTPQPTTDQMYPLQLNPFGSDDDNEEEPVETAQVTKRMVEVSQRRHSFNPFDSSDDEVELEKSDTPSIVTKPSSAPRVTSTNPFGSDTDDNDEDTTAAKRTPVPTPRKHIAGGTSLNTTPEPTPRMSRTLRHDLTPSSHLPMKSYNSETSLVRNHYLHGSSTSLASTSSSSHNAYTRRRKGRAPLPPVAALLSREQLTPSSNIEHDSYSLPAPPPPHSPTPSARPSPTSTRKKRPAPAPPRTTYMPPVCSTPRPTQSLHTSDTTTTTTTNSVYMTAVSVVPVTDRSATHADTDDFSDISVIADVADATSIVGTPELSADSIDVSIPNDISLSADGTTIFPDDTADALLLPAPHVRKLIPLDASLFSDSELAAAPPKPERTAANVVYRRRIIVPSVDTGDHTVMPNDDDKKVSDLNEDGKAAITAESPHARQWQKVKENKESQNKNRQSQISLTSSTHSPDSDGGGGGAVYSNKSTFGKWKRRKGPAPALPIPPRKILQMVPLQEIRHELEVIEVQQQGLEKQGIMLEKMIRERCEGSEMPIDEQGQPLPPNTTAVNTKEVEDLILQLFEIVNEKNELFRRQAELMYLRRLHRLEQEQADIEYEIRVLMAQPERNKTDSDKAREEGLIARKVEIVLQRNEVIDCLETDRLREAEEDQSIKMRLEMHNAKRDEELGQQTPTKLSKKEKKKQRESKKLTKQKKMDADKDADESESPVLVATEKKKKRKFLF